MLLPALALGAAASYLGIVLGLTIAAEIDDSLGQLNLWLPLVLLVLIPVAAPLLAGAGAAGICVACAATDDSNSHSGNGNLADP
ncbi:MAG TPA: hypothetical protein VE981_10600 [Planctomycetota bacterium]|nr:hypothetical protein [Planctomycetota bacterium]